MKISKRKALAALVFSSCFFMIRFLRVRTNFKSKSSCCGPSCRDKDPSIENHYSKKYFTWQTKLGREKAYEMDWNAFLGTSPNLTVADLGAGGGHVLARIDAKSKIAVEINNDAREAMKELYPGEIEIFKYPEEVPDESIDILLSTSALEHFECPLTELRVMFQKVKSEGVVIIGVKNEGPVFLRQIVQNDLHQHLYTWSHQQIYNLVSKAGFQVTSFEPSFAEIQIKYVPNLVEAGSFNRPKDSLYIWVRGFKPRSEAQTHFNGN